MDTHTRKARFSGGWYSKDQASLKQSIAQWTHGGESGTDSQALAMIGPHAALQYGGAVSGSGYKALKIPQDSRIFLLGPSHYAHFDGLALPSPQTSAFATPFGALRLDTDTIEALRSHDAFKGPSHSHEKEHSLELHTPFIAHLFPQTRLVPILTGRLGSEDRVRSIACKLRSFVHKDDLLIVSSDFTHYGAAFAYEPFKDQIPNGIQKLAQAAIKPLLTPDLAGFSAHLKDTGDTICGRESIRLLLALLPSDSFGALQSFTTSADQTGNYEHCVSYASIVFRSATGWEAHSS